MSELPPGWAEANLKELAEPRTERLVPGPDERRPYIGLEHVEPQSARILGSGQASSLRSATIPAKPGDTLYGRLRPYLNKVCTPDHEVLASAEFIVLRPSSALATKFLKYLLGESSFVGHAVANSSGDRPRVKWDDVGSFTFPLPPLAEQQRIVAAIEEQFSRADAADDSLQRAGKRCTALRETAVGALLAGDWPWTTLGDIAEIAGGVTKDAKRQTDPSSVEVPYLRVANVQRGYLDLREVATIRVAPHKAEALRLRTGDVLFNEGGDRDKLGRGWVWSGEIEACIHQNHVFRARLGDGFDPRFVSWHGNTFGRAWFEANGRQTTNLASLNMTTLKAFPVPTPPLAEQRRIVARIEQQLSLVDALSAEIDTALRRSNALRRAILKRALTGRLVPQDPADEPASALLERIAAERTATAPKSRGRRHQRAPA